MKLVFIFTLFLIHCYCDNYTYDDWKNCSDDQFRRIDFFTLTESASTKIKSTQAIIEFGIESIDINASVVFKNVTEKIQNAIKNMQSLLSNKNSTKFTTKEYSLVPINEYRTDQLTNISQNVFLGYRVKITLQIVSTELDKMGILLDAGIKNGLNKFQNLEFDISSQAKKDLEMDLMVQSIQNIQHKAQLVLNPFNHKIVGIKTVKLEYEEPQTHYYKYSSMFMNTADSFESAPTQVFASQTSVEKQVKISFIIESNK